MNLVLDYGNSTAKVGIFDGAELKERHTFADHDALLTYLGGVRVEHAIVGSVNMDPVALLPRIAASGKSFALTPDLPVPITVRYQTPATLGADRLAAVCGACALFPGVDALVIDAGSCVTYDLIDAQRNYLGGAISPGIEIRFQALHAFTARLPLITRVPVAPRTGHTTEQSIQSGVLNGVVGEMESFIAAYGRQFPGIAVILCGGDHSFFENNLKAAIFTSPDLVLYGLNSILRYNAR